MIASSIDEQALLGTPAEFASLANEYGTIGWEDDDDDDDSYYDLGSETNDGTTLVHVQLYRGKHPSTEVKPGIAQGHRLTCQLLGPLWHVPPRGTRVLVAFPGGSTAPGVPIVTGTVALTPTELFTGKHAHLQLPDGYGFAVSGSRGNFVRLAADGKVVLYSTDDGTANGQGVFWQVGPTGIIGHSPWVRQRYTEEGFHIVHAAAAIDGGAIGGLPPPLGSAVGSYVTIRADVATLASKLLSFGTDVSPLGSDAVAKATPTVAAIDAVGAFVAELMTFLGSNPGNVTGSALAAALATAAASVGTAVTSANATTPSLATMTT